MIEKDRFTPDEENRIASLMSLLPDGTRYNVVRVADTLMLCADADMSRPDISRTALDRSCMENRIHVRVAPWGHERTWDLSGAKRALPVGVWVDLTPEVNAAVHQLVNAGSLIETRRTRTLSRDANSEWKLSYFRKNPLPGETTVDQPSEFTRVMVGIPATYPPSWAAVDRFGTRVLVPNGVFVQAVRRRDGALVTCLRDGEEWRP